MRKRLELAAIVCCFFVSGSALSDQWINGYMKSDGTYVQGHYRSGPDSYRYNNRNSQSNGGYQRDEFSSGMGATNRNNSSWDYRDNDNDGVTNRYDRSPEPKSNCYGYYCD